MRKVVKIYFFFFFSILSSTISAQDIHFSQFYAAPISLNPAKTGSFNGDWRIANNHRNQWSSISEAFLTTSFAFDMKFKLFHENFSFGIGLFNDKTGYAGLRTMQGAISLAYEKPIGSSSIHIAFQGAYNERSLDWENATFPDQYNSENGSFDNTLNTNDIVIGDKVSYPDLNAGILWRKRTGSFRPEFGAAIYHINEPNESFYSFSSYKLEKRYVSHFGIFKDFGKSFYINPRMSYMFQKNNTEFIFGSLVGVYLQKNDLHANSVFGGGFIRDGFTRNFDSYIAIVGVNFKNFDIGLSYDINASNLRQASHLRGGYEISIVYTGFKLILDEITIPCDRY